MNGSKPTSPRLTASSSELIALIMNLSSGRFLKRLLEKDHLHPFLKEIKNWSLDKTPNIVMILLFGKDSRFLEYFSPGKPEYQVEPSVEDITENLVYLLVGYVFRNELPELNDTKKGWAGFLDGYTEMAKNPPPEQEIKFLFENNPWLRTKLKNLIESIRHRIEYSYTSFAKAHAKHREKL
jgi:hypothetical protein